MQIICGATEIRNHGIVRYAEHAEHAVSDAAASTYRGHINRTERTD